MRKTIAFVCLAVLLLLSVWTTSAESRNIWIKLPSGPAERIGATTVDVAGSGMLVFAGYGDGGCHNELHIFWGQDKTWQQITPQNEPPPPRLWHTAERVADDMWVFGGGGTMGGPHYNDLWRYNIQENKWYEVTPANEPPAARMTHTMWAKDNKLYIAGGWGDGPEGLDDTWYYDIATNTWHQVSDAPKAFSKAKSAVDKKEDLAYVFPLDTRMYIYNMDSDTWHQELYGPGAPSPRTDYALAQNDYRAFMIGGRDSSGLIWSSVYSFNFARSKWTKLANMPVGTAGAAATVISGEAFPMKWAVLAYGGETATEPATDTLRAYIPVPTEETTVDPEGDTLEFAVPGGKTIIVVPAQAMTVPVGLSFTPQAAPSHTLPATGTLAVAVRPASPDLGFAGYAFLLEAYSFPDWELLPGFAFSQPFTLTLHYTDTRIASVYEDTLRLYYWDGSQWLDAAGTCDPPSTYDRHPDENWLALPICHPSEFALVGMAKPHLCYLPAVVKGGAK